MIGIQELNELVAHGRTEGFQQVVLVELFRRFVHGHVNLTHLVHRATIRATLGRWDLQTVQDLHVGELYCTRRRTVLYTVEELPTRPGEQDVP